MEEDNKQKIILATLFLTLKLLAQFHSFQKKSANIKKGNSLAVFFQEKPSLKDLLYILFPSPEKPVLALSHLHYAGSKYKRKVINDQFKRFFSSNSSSAIDWNNLPEDLDFSGIIHGGHKTICRWYALSIGMDVKDQPQWLN